jgi:hypothetical protein
MLDLLILACFGFTEVFKVTADGWHSSEARSQEPLSFQEREILQD